jgi:hypothetical protein
MSCCMRVTFCPRETPVRWGSFRKCSTKTSSGRVSSSHHKTAVASAIRSQELFLDGLRYSDVPSHSQLVTKGRPLITFGACTLARKLVKLSSESKLIDEVSAFPRCSCSAVSSLEGES